MLKLDLHIVKVYLQAQNKVPSSAQHKAQNSTHRQD